MTNTQVRLTVESAWRKVRCAIDKAYLKDVGGILKNYAEDQGFVDSLEELLVSSVQDERRHRRNRTVKGFSCETASKLLLAAQFVDGSKAEREPSATIFLIWRKSYAEMFLLGWLAREFVAGEWTEVIKRLDYTELMTG